MKNQDDQAVDEPIGERVVIPIRVPLSKFKNDWAKDDLTTIVTLRPGGWDFVKVLLFGFSIRVEVSTETSVKLPQVDIVNTEIKSVAPNWMRNAWRFLRHGRRQQVYEEMHPTGACIRGGEGSCRWCREHCVCCGTTENVMTLVQAMPGTSPIRKALCVECQMNDAFPEGEPE